MALPAPPLHPALASLHSHGEARGAEKEETDSPQPPHAPFSLGTHKSPSSERVRTWQCLMANTGSGNDACSMSTRELGAGRGGQHPWTQSDVTI